MWYRSKPIRVGSQVREHDGRHVARVDAIYGGLLGNGFMDSAIATVRWLDTGWRSQMPLSDLEPADAE